MCHRWIFLLYVDITKGTFWLLILNSFVCLANVQPLDTWANPTASEQACIQCKQVSSLELEQKRKPETHSMKSILGDAPR